MGAITDEGRPLVQYLSHGTDHGITIELMEQRRKAIRDAFFVDQFAEREGVQPLTATESMHNQENKMRLLGPQIKRMIDEYLIPLVLRVFRIAQRAGELPPLPEGYEAVELELEFVSPLSVMQKGNQLLSYNRLFANAGTLVQISPQVTENLEMDKLFRDAAVGSGIPLERLKPLSEVLAAREQAAAQQQAMVASQMMSEQIASGADSAAKLQKAGINVIPQ
jgi:hypothetical protein